MEKRFKNNEVARVIGELVTKQKKRNLSGEVGIVISNEYCDAEENPNCLVGFNTYGEVIAVPTQHLESLGRIAEEGEFISRSRTKGNSADSRDRNHKR